MSFTRYPFAAPVEVARNLVPNPSLEVDTLSYSASAGAPSILRTSTAWVGSWALRVLATTTSTNDVQIDYSFITVLPNTEYTFSFYARAGTTPRDVRGLLRFYTAGGVQVGTTVIGASAMDTTTGWTRYTVTATSGATAVRASPVFRIAAPAIGESHYFDGIMMNAGPTALTYFDGSFPAADPVFYRWVSTANASASVAETAGASDVIQPLIDITAPFTVAREARSVARPLLESSETRAVLLPAGPRKGTMQSVFETPTEAMSALSFFASAARFKVVDETYASMWFAVSDGDVVFEQGEAGVSTVTIPFVEVAAP